MPNNDTYLTNSFAKSEYLDSQMTVFYKNIRLTSVPYLFEKDLPRS